MIQPTKAAAGSTSPRWLYFAMETIASSFFFVPTVSCGSGLRDSAMHAIIARVSTCVRRESAEVSAGVALVS